MRRLVGYLLIIVFALGSIAADGDDEHRRRADPDNPGGERVGDDDGADGFTGYPADPGEPDDLYYDATAEHQPYSPNWTGLFIGGGLIGGASFLRSDVFDDNAVGARYGAFLNASSLLHIADAQLSYTRASYSTSLLGEDTTLNRDSLTASFLLHPALLAIINGPAYGFPLASIYISIGASLEFVSVDSASVDHNYSNLGWHLGGGFDYPLDNPQDGSSFWLGFQYLWNHTGGDTDDEIFSREQLLENIVMLRLSYRMNIHVFRNMPGPDAP